MLQYLQDSVIVERALGIVKFVSERLKGDFNFILVDRSNLLETAFDEIRLIENPRLTLQVQFYGEVSNSVTFLAPSILSRKYLNRGSSSKCKPVLNDVLANFLKVSLK